MKGDRGVSSVVATVLLIAVVLLVAVTAGGYVLQFAEQTREPSPQFHASMEPISASDGTLVVTKNGGDEIDVDELEILIRNQDNGTWVRLVDLPSSGSTLDASNLEGDAGLVDESSASGELVDAGGDGIISAGDAFVIDLPNVNPGDRITVQVIHPQTDAIIWEDATNATG